MPIEVIIERTIISAAWEGEEGRFQIRGHVLLRSKFKIGLGNLTSSSLKFNLKSKLLKKKYAAYSVRLLLNTFKYLSKVPEKKVLLELIANS